MFGIDSGFCESVRDVELVRAYGRCKTPRMDYLDTPNYPACLMRMEPVDGMTTTLWKCPECGLVKL